MSVSITLDSEHKRPMDAKRISVSKKRQITIPKPFFEKMNIQDEVECILTDSQTMLICPVRKEEEFTVEILRDLTKQGYQGEELVEQFIKTRAKIRPAVERMLEEAALLAKKLEGSGDEKLNEIFADLDG